MPITCTGILVEQFYLPEQCGFVMVVQQTSFFLPPACFLISISDHNLGLTVTKLGAMMFCQLAILPTAVLS